MSSGRDLIHDVPRASEIVERLVSEAEVQLKRASTSRPALIGAQSHFVFARRKTWHSGFAFGPRERAGLVSCTQRLWGAEGGDRCVVGLLLAAQGINLPDHGSDVTVF
jgi:hypothetical protein